jgi:hypothetical protein
VVERLHWTFDDFDRASYADLCDLLEVWRADEAARKRAEYERGVQAARRARRR